MGVLVICVLVFTVFCIVCTVFLYCFVYVYYLFCFYQCKDCCRRVKKLQEIIIMTIIMLKIIIINIQGSGNFTLEH